MLGGTLIDKKTIEINENLSDHEGRMHFTAAHEVGHAIQHAKSYTLLSFRSAWVPVANLGGGLSMIVIMLAFFLGGVQTATGASLSWLGVLLFGCTTLFTLITLPVEFDASFKRALPILQKYVPKENMRQCRSVLRAAAFTYLAQSIVSIFRLKIILFSFINILKSIIRR